MISNYNVGDFVSFIYDTKEVYPGRILSKKDKGIFEVEIFISQKGSLERDVEIVEGTETQFKK